MFSKKYKEIIQNIIKKLPNDIDKELIDDYITFHTVLMSLYARNLFKINSHWMKLKKSHDVNYSYIKDNNTSYKLTDIEKQIKYKLIFIDGLITNFDTHHQDFIDYIRLCMKICITDIGVPFKILSPKIRGIIDKYKNNDYVMNYLPKSKKINYEVLDKILLS